MDLATFKSNELFDSIISKVFSNSLSYKEALSYIQKNVKISDNNEIFLLYFLNSLHASCYWIIYNSSNTYQSSPIKSDLKKNNDDNEIKKNFEEKLVIKKLDENLSLKKIDEKFEIKRRIDDKNEIKKKIDLNDLNMFPKLNDLNMFPKLNDLSFDQSFEVEKVDSKTNSNKKQRRINPTLIMNKKLDNLSINKSKNHSDKVEENIFREAPILDKKDIKLREEIKLMKSDVINITPIKKKAKKIQIKSLNKNLDNFSAIKFDLKKVTLDNNFENFILFYIHLIKSNLVPNVLTEIDFLLQIVIRKLNNENTNDFLKVFQVFSNYHNCKYFAVKALEKLFETTLQEYFDTSFFKTLSFNESIISISNEFEKKLKNFKDTNNNQDHDLSLTIPSFDFIAFQPEQDSKETFVNDHSFHVFRKQRDAFFKLYHEWKQFYSKNNFKNDSELLNDKKFDLSRKISFIFDLSKNTSNYHHLAKLFLAQLMQCCVGTKNLDENIKENENFVKKNQSIPSNSCENKIKKLNKRFNLQEQKVMATQSSFIGEEIFFYEFISLCNNYSFLIILRSLIFMKINELNDPNLLLEAIELEENNFEVASYFCTNLLNLQLLSKFLGLIVFMPYYTKDQNFNKKNLNDDSLTINLDEMNCLNKKLKDFLNMSIKRKHLVLTLPWVIQFLNQIEPNSLVFLSYDSVLNLLIDIYRNLGLKNNQYKMNNLNLAYLNLIFGNFFEKYVSNTFDKILQIKEDNFDLFKLNDLDKNIDSYSLINKKFIHDCFPKLFILKQMIKQNTNQNIEARKITPLSLNYSEENNFAKVTPSSKTTKNLIQIEFEENFFRLHADSLRKSVEFLADRSYSKCIKKLRYEKIKVFKKLVFDKHNNSNLLDDTILEEIRQLSFDFVKEYSDQHLVNIIDSLLSEHDYNENVKKIAKSITLRIILDKSKNWINNNINETFIFNEILANENKQKIVKEINVNLDSLKKDIPDISYSFNFARDIICDLLFKNDTAYTSEELIKLIKEFTEIRKQIKKLPARTLHCIEITIIDLIITTVSYKPSVCIYDFMLAIINFYKENNLEISNFISPRNFYILSLSKDSYTSWNKYESILIMLMQKNIYHIPTLETDILCVLGQKNDWNENCLKKLASCIKSAVETCKTNEKNKEFAEKIELIDWLSWFCGQDPEAEI